MVKTGLKYFIFIFISVIFTITAFSNNFSDSVNLKLKNANDSKKIEIYFDLYQYYHDMDSMELSLTYANKALFYAQKLKDLNQIAKLYSRIGYIYLYWDDLLNAQKYFLNTIKICHDSKDKSPLLFVYRGLGRTNMLINNYETAQEYYTKGLELCNLEKNEKEKAIYNNEIGNLYLHQNNFEKAKFHYEEFYRGGVHLKDSMIIVYAFNNLAIINRKMGKYKEAISQSEIALNYMVNHNLLMGQASTLGGIAEIYIIQKDYKKALSLYMNSNQIAENVGFKYWTADNHKQISRIYTYLGKSDSALAHYIIFSQLKDTLLNIEKEKQIRLLESKHQIEQNEKKIIILEKESKNKGMLLYITFSTIFLALIIIFQIYKSSRLKRKLFEKEKLELDDALNQKNRELVSVLMESVHKKQLIENFEKEIDSMIKIENLNDKTLEIANNIKGKLKSGSYADDEWTTLKKHFEEIHPEFFSKLIAKHGELTQLELRHCAYIKINLSSKDVARILNISVRSVQTSRYRLKKKLKLDEDTNVLSYIHSI